MPPRKKQRLSYPSTASPTPADQEAPQSSPPANSPSKPTISSTLLTTPWTDEEEIGLFKGLIKWKPTGIHKHFRMLQLRNYLIANAYIHPRAVHTRFPGIWAKLQELYDLAALDEREDARQLDDVSGLEDSGLEDSDEVDVYSLAENKIRNERFALPVEEYGDSMWARRLPGPKESREESESPAILPEINLMEKAPARFVPSFSVENSENATPARGASGRGRGRSKGRGRGAAAAAAPPGGTRRSTRQVTSEEVEGEEEVEGSTNAEEEVEESSEGDEASAESTPAPQTGQRGRGRGRGTRGGGRRGGRGRGK